MSAFSLHIKPGSCGSAIWIWLFLLIGSSCLAQVNERPKDTISVAGNTSGVDSSAISAAADTGSSETTAPPAMRAIPDSVIGGYKKEKDFAYANDPAFWQKKKEKSGSNGFLHFLQSLFLGKWFQYFIYILLGGVLVYALIRIVSENNLRLFDRSSRKTLAGMDGVTELPEEDLEERLRQAMQDKDYRLGVRYLFLKTLRVLNEQGMILYHMQATNQEYINQLSGHSQAGPFKFLAKAYDHVWYGGFSINEQQFGRLSGHFQDFFRSITEK
jgi:uncharacterized protein DUF4129